MLIGGALANTLAFTGSSYLFSRLSKDSIDKERKKHDLALEQLQKAQIKWAQKRQQRIDLNELNWMMQWENIMRYLVTSFYPCLENLY